MRQKTNKILLSIPFLALLFFYSCGNTSNKQSAKQVDSMTTDQEWSNAILGNFSPQDAFYFDSAEINLFLNKYPQFMAGDSNIMKFYDNRKYTYAWFDEQGLIEQAENLVDRVSNLKTEGVFTEPLYKKELDSLLLHYDHTEGESKPNINLELMLTAQYFEFAKQAWEGSDLKVSEASAWFVPRKKITYEAYLDSLLKSPPNKEKSLKEPVYRQYELLKAFLQTYRKLENTLTWPILTMEQNSYKKGDSSVLLADIKARLHHLGDFKGDTSSSVFDQDLEDAVKHFQNRLGLTVDGTIGKGTMQELNVTPGTRVRQLIINMERCRWLPVSLTEDYLAVNIPEFKLHVYHADSLLWSTNVIVGKEVHKTVVFSGEVKYVVFSPYWNVPTSIVRNEIVPAIARNPNYIRQHNMEITGHQGNLPIVRQKPGPSNSLGLVKFLFPNSHSIYLHDSPAKSLFDQTTRAFSHGCIRVQEPKKLAEFLLGSDSSWTDDAIVKAMNRGVEKTVTLENPVPVFITYFTAFVDRNGKINFRKDIYDRDERLAKMIIEDN